MCACPRLVVRVVRSIVLNSQSVAPGLPDRPSREPDGTRPSSAILVTSAVAVAAASALDRRREHELSGGRCWSASDVVRTAGLRATFWLKGQE